MDIQTNVSLKSYNTFGIAVNAAFFLELNTIDQALEFFRLHYNPSQNLLILGGGSNILFTKDFDGLVLKNNLKGIEKIKEDEEHIWVEVMAGENWHEFVQYTIQQNWAGLENLSLIPGNVGASPMQNIGAYGVEVKSLIEKVKAIEIPTDPEAIERAATPETLERGAPPETLECSAPPERSRRGIREFSAKECKFGYRTSIFKTTHKNQFFITSVVYKLNKKPTFHISYGAIAEELEKLSGDLSIQKISQAVINIRESKLPDPKVIGNAGSFFKNPLIEKQQYVKLSEQFPDMPVYPVGEEQVKLAAGWLIEQCGWKGKDMGGYGVHEKQALVLVNYGNAKGLDIFELSEKVIESVNEKFGIVLEREVNVVGCD